MDDATSPRVPLDKTLRVYIAAAYPEREIVEQWGHRLREAGIIVTSRWIWAHEDDDDPAQKEGYALKDLSDIAAADAVLLRTGYSGPRAASGGRHVEFGYAMARGKLLFIVGPRESVFHYLPEVYQCDTLEQWLTIYGAALVS